MEKPGRKWLVLGGANAQRSLRTCYGAFSVWGLLRACEVDRRTWATVKLMTVAPTSPVTGAEVKIRRGFKLASSM